MKIELIKERLKLLEHSIKMLEKEPSFINIKCALAEVRFLNAIIQDLEREIVGVPKSKLGE